MKLIHCILSIALAGALCSSLLPATAEATCAGGSCAPSGGGPPRGGGGGGGGHGGGGGGGGTNWGGVAAGVGAAIITGIIQQQMSEQNRQPVYKEPAHSRRAQRRSGSGSSEDTSDDVGDGSKVAVIETSPIDPPLNQYAQVPSDISDPGIATDASVGPARETTGSVGSSDSTTDPHVPNEQPDDNSSISGQGVKWVLIKGVEAVVWEIPVLGPWIVTSYEVGSNGNKIKKGTEEALKKNEAEQAEHDKAAEEITRGRDANIEQAQEQWRDLR
jgi:hypothetical protein